MLIGLILLSVILAALAQLTLKHGMNQVTARERRRREAERRARSS